MSYIYTHIYTPVVYLYGLFHELLLSVITIEINTHIHLFIGD